MIKEPIIFESPKHAIKVLNEYKKYHKFPLLNTNKQEIIKASVTSNIFRALKTKRKSPSIIYRDWAIHNIDFLYEDLIIIKSQEEYNNILFKYSNKFLNYWKMESNDPQLKIGFGPGIKIINLLIKTFQESSNYRKQGIYKYMHVPLDYFTLLPLRQIFNEISNVDYKISIPTNPSMKFIVNRELYDIFMGAIFTICNSAKIDPIIYDYWAWNRTH